MAGNVEALLVKAGEAHRSGRYEEAVLICKDLLNRDPKLVAARTLLGVLYCRLNRDEKAISELAAALEQDPGSFDALMWLATAQRKLDRHQEATETAALALAVRPDSPAALNSVGIGYLAGGRATDAAEYLRKATALQPNNPGFQLNFGRACEELALFLEGAAAFSAALALDPSLFDAACGAAEANYHLGRMSDAEHFARMASAIRPESALGPLLLAKILLASGSTAEAKLALESGIANDREGTYAVNIALNLRHAGDLSGAEKHLRRAMDRGDARAFGEYFLNRKAEEVDRPVIERAAKLTQLPSLEDRDKAALQFGLGKALEDLGDYEEAMVHYDIANQLAKMLKFGNRPFDRQAYAAHIDELIRLFSKDHLAENTDLGNPSDMPIFLTGMIRSGTTLVEQILSRNPMVAAAGEEPFWAENVRRLYSPTGLNKAVTQSVTAQYLEKLSRISRARPRVTDKMPVSSLYLGPLYLAMPRAKYVLVKRNPADTCLSIYTTPNEGRVPFAHDRAAIAFAYRQYLRLMEHWREALPPGVLLELQYEDLVSDTKPTVQKLLDFCDLEWDEACLSPERSERAVLTPSVWQVRQPIYRTSTERWRRFDKWIPEFVELLGPPIC
jgi:tetratricopeptide (TPR) repeat protein